MAINLIQPTQKIISLMDEMAEINKKSVDANLQNNATPLVQKPNSVVHDPQNDLIKKS